MKRLLWILALSASASVARALPVDEVVELEVGEVHFLRQNYVEAAEVDQPELCTVERLPSLELLLTPKRAGSALLYLFEEGRLEVFRLRIHDSKAGLVAAPADDGFATRLAAAKAVCPVAQERLVDGDRFLHLRIPDARCREAALRLLESDRYLTRQLRIRFDVSALQAQLIAMKARLDAAGVHGLSLAYAGATLSLRGAVDAETRHRALRALWPAAVGRIDLEDRTEPPGSDGGF